MAPRLGYDNFCRRSEAPASASAGSSGIGTPAKRLLTSALSEVWRSAAGVNSTWIQIDLDGAEEIDTVVIPSSNLTPTAEWRVRIGTGDLTNPANIEYDSGTVSAAVVDPWTLAALFLEVAVTGESIRIDLADDILDEIEVGRVWITKSRRFDHWYNYGWEQSAVDFSTSVTTQDGETFNDERPIARTFSLSFPAMTNADRAAIREVHRLVGASREILLCLDDESDSLGSETVLATMDIQPISSVSPNLWSWTLSCKERL